MIKHNYIKYMDIWHILIYEFLIHFVTSLTFSQLLRLSLNAFQQKKRQKKNAVDPCSVASESNKFNFFTKNIIFSLFALLFFYLKKNNNFWYNMNLRLGNIKYSTAIHYYNKKYFLKNRFRSTSTVCTSAKSSLNFVSRLV